MSADASQGRRPHPCAPRISSLPPARPSPPLPGVEIDEKSHRCFVPAHWRTASCRGRMVVIGGGVIGLELAASGGGWVRRSPCVEFLDQILPGFDGEVRKESNKIFKKRGIDFKLATKVTQRCRVRAARRR